MKFDRFGMIDVLSAIAALAAAGFWFWSSTVPFPKVTTLESLDDVYPKLRAQSQRSAYAAMCAGLAALFQVFDLGISYF